MKEETKEEILEEEQPKKPCEKEEGCTCSKEKKEKHKKCNKKFEEELLKVKQENEELQEKIKYAQAELINYRKRKEEEMSSALKYANQDLILEILPILDNFERAIQLDDNNLTDELSKFLAGFKMMYAMLADVMKQFGVEEIEASQKEFDASCMEALMTDQDTAFPNGTVLEVLLKGYKLKDRVIRPCSVKVNQLENEGEDKNE